MTFVIILLPFFSLIGSILVLFTEGKTFCTANQKHTEQRKSARHSPVCFFLKNHVLRCRFCLSHSSALAQQLTFFLIFKQKVALFSILPKKPTYCTYVLESMQSNYGSFETLQLPMGKAKRCTSAHNQLKSTWHQP